MSVSAILASVLLLAGAPQAAPQPRSDDLTEVEAVIVEGRRLEEVARSYVEQVSEPPRGARLARWNEPICISVSNMQSHFAQFVIDRIAINALDAGADVAGPGCRPNVIVLATIDGSALAQRLVSEFGLGFRPAIQHTNRSRAALREFQNSREPVRWWNVSMPVEASSGEIAARLHGDFLDPDGSGKPRMVVVRDGSRIRSNIRHDMAWTIVIIDMSRTDGVTLGVLADYVSMVSLAQIDPAADLTGQQTIMNLFRTGGTMRGLTSWDKDYLVALYSASPNRFDNRSQEAAVTRALVRQRLAEDEQDRRHATPSDGSPQP
ncbi:hypothetical protein [Brevundimonas diminuta]|jgi:hypothetical protein|uniref:hypothetical protein n=1 Tax=Brevundimonas diminuta TaxID=293 RepID=UPI000B352439|nr:hypothetical protein [Brevundimonas diminuta]